MVAIVRYPLYVGALVALLLAPGVLGSASAQQRVGVNSAVNPEATGIFPGAAPRPLVLGGQVVLNERIATGSIGQTQILFIDGSSMSLGPNAFMVIDRFRYDPDFGRRHAGDQHDSAEYSASSAETSASRTTRSQCRHPRRQSGSMEVWSW